MINFSEEEELKKTVGALGLYLINKALQEIKEIHRQILFQKTEIRKQYEDKLNTDSLAVKNDFIEEYNQFLNDNLTVSLLKSKEKILNLKNQLKEDLKVSLNEFIKKKINDNYSNYIEFLLDFIKNISKNIDNHGEISFTFNSNDYNYFLKKFNKIEELFNDSVIIQQSSEQFTGGFKVGLSQAIITYDYTFDTLINKNYTNIELMFSNTISDLEYKELNAELEEFIKRKRKEIEEYLRKYDQIK